MNILKSIWLVFVLSLPLTAVAEPASETSIRQLFAVIHVESIFGSVMSQADSIINDALKQTLLGKAPTAKQQQAIANMRNRTVALLREEFAWEKIEPVYIRLYKEAFTEEEVVGMLSFYQTPVGQAAINKVPFLMARGNAEVGKMLSNSAPRLNKIMEDFVSEMDKCQ